MSSGICKNVEEDKRDNSKKSTIFNFWIYFGIIILGLLFIILVILIIYSFFSNKEVTNNKPNISTPIPTPTFQSKDLTSFQNIPVFSSASIPPPLPQINTETISTNKKPFLSSLMSKTTDSTDKAFKSLVSPLYDRNIPIKTTGGFRCMNRRRF
jgi:heme/copper-type cytochrome/quinol oxidase subunit 1